MRRHSPKTLPHKNIISMEAFWGKNANGLEVRIAAKEIKMKQLELRVYSKKDICNILNIDINDSKHYKSKLETRLNNWGYQYKYKSNEVIITKIPETNEELLQELMLREFDMNSNSKFISCAYFIYCLNTNENFRCMPWAAREEYLLDVYGVHVTSRTMRTWLNNLRNRGIVYKGDNIEYKYWKTSWKSLKEHNKYERTMLDEDEWKSLKKEYSDIFNNFLVKVNNSGDAHFLTRRELGWVVYKSEAIGFLKIDNDILTLLELVENIVGRVN